MTNGINQLIAQGVPVPDWMKSRTNALALRQAEREYGEYPEERNWLKQQRGMATEKFGWERQQEIERIKNKAFENQDAAWTWYKGILDVITPENWGELRNVVIGRVKASGGNSTAMEKIIPETFPGWDWVNTTKGKLAEKPTLIPKGTMGTMTGGKIEPLPPELKQPEEKETKPDIQKRFELAFSEWKDKEGKPGYDEAFRNFIATEGKIPSAGNAVDLAIKRKFGTEYLTDRKKAAEADKWLDTKEGRKAVQQARDDLTPPAITYLQTGEGFVPAVTRGQGIGTVGKPTGLEKPLPSEQIVSEQQIGTLRDMLNIVKENYKKDYVGFVSGRIGGIKEKTTGLPEDQARFYSALAQTKNSLVYLLSGKQINEEEYKRLLNQLPTRELPSSVFEARMKNFEMTMNSIVKERRKAMGGYKKPSGEIPTSAKKDWMSRAKAKNPNSSDQELSDYYDKKYGGK